jgi:uroporphyrinogen decarboxylase
LDWRIPIPIGRSRLGSRYAVQGNLDPYVLTAPMSVIEEHARIIIDEAIDQPGYIFNLGHGLFPEASPEKLEQLTSFVQSYSAEAIAARKATLLTKEGK